MRHISLESLSLDIPVWCQLVGPTRHVPDPGTAQGAFPVSGRAVDLLRTPRAADAGASGWAEPPGRPANLRGPPPPRALPGGRWVRNRSATTALRLRTKAGPARRAITVKPRPGPPRKRLATVPSSGLPAGPQQAGSRLGYHAGPPPT